MRKKPFLIATAVIAVAATIVAAALIKGSPAVDYGFLQGGEPVVNIKATSGPGHRTVRYRVYNVRREYAEFLPEFRKQLAAHGWTPSVGTSHRYAEMYFKRPVTPWVSGSVATVAFMAVASPGRSELAEPGSDRIGIEPKETVEGWTTVMLYEEYSPNWLQSMIDRYAGAPVRDVNDYPLRYIASSAALKDIRSR
jgi:hypothetical protein